MHMSAIISNRLTLHTGCDRKPLARLSNIGPPDRVAESQKKIKKKSIDSENGIWDISIARHIIAGYVTSLWLSI